VYCRYAKAGIIHWQHIQFFACCKNAKPDIIHWQKVPLIYAGEQQK